MGEVEMEVEMEVERESEEFGFKSRVNWRSEFLVLVNSILVDK